MSAEWCFVPTWPTFPEPTPAMDYDGEVVTFDNRQDAIRYAEENGMPYPEDNVQRRKRSSL